MDSPITNQDKEELESIIKKLENIQIDLLTIAHRYDNLAQSRINSAAIGLDSIKSFLEEEIK